MSQKLDGGHAQAHIGKAKDKTSAVLGSALTTFGRGFRVCFASLFKKNVTGEAPSAKEYLSGKLLIH